jgi:hypothetical protein
MATNHLQASHLAPGRARARGELNALIDLLPSSVDLISPRSIASQSLQLLSNAANGRRFVAVLMSMQSHLREAAVPVLVTEPKESAALVDHDELSRSQRRWVGQLALELYFTQLFRSEVTVLDLWPSRFGVDENGDAVWSPRPFYVRWEPRYREGIRDVYAGFFLEDRERFDRGVSELGLQGAAGALLGHLGPGNQRSVRFGAEKLRSTLSAMSGQREAHDPRLHRNFVAFGLYLTALHELLGSLDMAYDVRAAFMRSYPGNRQR